MGDIDTAQPQEADGRTYGWIIIIGSLATLGGMVIHPTGGGRVLEMVRNLVGPDGLFNAWLHGALIAVYLVLVLGFLGLTRRLGADRPLAQAGFIAYVAGIFAAIMAGISAGFVNRALAFAYANATQEQAEYVVSAFRVGGAYNFAFGRMWIIAMSVAILLWSLAMMNRSGAARALGMLGVVVGGGTAVAYPLDLLPLSVFAVVAILVAHAVWSVAAGVLMVRRTL